MKRHLHKDENKKIQLKYSTIIVFVVILVILIIVVFGIKYIIDTDYEYEHADDPYLKIIGIWEQKPTNEDKEKRKEEIKKENQTIDPNQKIEDDYINLNIIRPGERKDYFVGYKKTKDITLIIEMISQYFGYEIKCNNVQIANNRVKINFKLTSAPFNNEDTAILSKITKPKEGVTKKDLCYSMLDSLTSTIKTNFGKNIKVYYSMNGKDIEINDIEPKLVLKKNREYKYLIKDNK